MINDHSFSSLMEFLDYLGRKGLMNNNTVTSRKAACNKVLSVLDDEELADLRNLDLESVAGRFTNLQGKGYAPKSLRVYKSRVSSSLDDFFRYRDNPATFSVSAKPRKRVSTSSKSVKIEGGEAATATAQSHPKIPSRGQTIDVPIAISSEHIVQINGLPVSLTEAEAKKIANVVMAMASPAE